MSCDNEDAIPAYIQIDEYQITANAATQGSNSHNIQDVWVYANNNLIGAFNLPATIPILEEGSVDIIIDPGIRDNGISASPRIYPYYTRYETTVELISEQVTAVTPSSTYTSDLKFVFKEDFEESNIFSIDRDMDNLTRMGQTSVGAIEGTAGVLDLSTAHPINEVATNIAYSNLPLTGSVDVYLELNYKADVDFAIGLIGYDDFGAIQVFYSHVLTAKGEWNKAYLNFTEVLFNSRMNSYQVAFLAGLPDGLSEAKVLVDNVKLVHRE